MEGKCRGFGHLTLECDDQDYSKCQSVLNGSSWKGARLHIEPAKAHFLDNLQKNSTDATEVIVKLKRHPVRHAANMSLIDEKNMEGRKGWRRGKFGRPIAIVKLRKPDRTLVVMDPSHDPCALEKFYEGFRPRPVRNLTWFAKNVPHISTPDNDMEGPEHIIGDEDAETPVELNSLEQEIVQVRSTVEDISAVSVPAKTWEQMVSGSGFSLSLALNLPVPETVPEPVPVPVAVRDLSAMQPVKRAKLSELLFDFSQVFSLQDPNDLFLLHGSRMESVTIWKAGRSDIRKDFKKQAKAAKRYARKRHNVVGRA
jgi:hypothetical protein